MGVLSRGPQCDCVVGRWYGWCVWENDGERGKNERGNDELENDLKKERSVAKAMEDIAGYCKEVGGEVYAEGYDASLIGREFVHFKGGHYRLLGFAKTSETEETVVVYQTLYGDCGMWVRPAKMFFENVTRDGVTQPRFRPVG